MFKPFPPTLKLPELESDVLDLWSRERIFDRSLEKNRDGQSYIFYEGPPTANGRPGIHHVLARAFKDVYNRYKTMRGFHVARKGGWDTHGLPVEREVEKELGILHKDEIVQKIGIAEFNRRCRESVHRYIGDWNRLTERMGFWLDLEHPYYTLENSYIESVWWLLEQLWDKGLIYQAYKVVPYDPQVGATMSSHEVGLGYREIDDPSVFVKVRVTGRDRTALLVWTTTPWTLPSNVALAVHPDEDYVEVAHEGETLILARALLGKVFGDAAPAPAPAPVPGRTFPGRELEGVRYERLFDVLPMEGDGARVVCETFVTMGDGTGIVHIAPAYGADDLAARDRHDLPILFGVGLDGRFAPGTPWAGQFFKDADPRIIEDLDRRGRLLRSETYRHSYPFGWRTDCPLLYYAKNEWYIRTTAFKDALMANNRQIRWIPEHIRDGRFGDWLENNVDWALSRERFWGTPLPIWTDGEGAFLCVGSLAELEGLCGTKLGEIDLHRPAVDEITFPHPTSGKTMRRVPEVIDCWFDSGAMPYAQWHYPFENRDTFRSSFPADFIAEAVDQTRGWFYTLHAIATMVFGGPAYRNCVCLGHVVDATGAKMSKSKGNVVDPWDVFDTHGADALRWFFLVGSPPGSSKRVSVDLVAEMVHGTFNTLWNTCAFFVMYANLDQPDLIGSITGEELQPIDRWILSRLNTVLQEVGDAMDRYDVQDAGRRIEGFVDELSNWYVRLNRRRFWKGEDDRSKRAAYWTLYLCLRTLTTMTAPITPFLSEHLFQILVRPVEEDAPDSVHLEDWPGVDPGLIDRRIMTEMDLAMRIIGLGRAARIKAGLKTRQPLTRAMIVIPPGVTEDTIRAQENLIADELNVKSVRVLTSSTELVQYGLRPNLPRIGPRLGKLAGRLKAVLPTVDAGEVVRCVRSGRPYQLEVDGTPVTLEEQDLLIDSRPAEGLASAEEAGLVVSLDTRLTHELVLEGMARDVIRIVQESRKKAGLDVADRIHLSLEAGGELGEAIAAHRDTIMKETLSVSLNERTPASRDQVPLREHTLQAGLEKA